MAVKTNLYVTLHIRLLPLSSLFVVREKDVPLVFFSVNQQI